MFRTARGFLVIVPLAFVAALGAYLVTYGRAAASFAPYPFLAEPLGQGLAKHPVERFAIVSSTLFLVPYIVGSILLFLADAGLEVASRLWRQPARPERGHAAHLPPEGLWTFVISSLALSVVAARSIDRFAHGGELPGGINIAPVLLALTPFLATAAALVLTAIAIIPRGVAALLTRSTPRGPRKG